MSRGEFTGVVIAAGICLCFVLIYHYFVPNPLPDNDAKIIGLLEQIVELQEDAAEERELLGKALLAVMAELEDE
jgi:hypothetical protein